MTPHPLILAELQKYRGGEFVPTSFCSTLRKNTGTGFHWCSGTAASFDCDQSDAHVHIELAAIKMLHRAGEVWMPKSLTPEALLAAVRKINEKENA